LVAWEVGPSIPPFLAAPELRTDTLTVACRLHRKGRGSSLEHEMTSNAAW